MRFVLDNASSVLHHEDMSEYKLWPMPTRFGVRWHVQVTVAGRHVAWHEFNTREQAEAWIAR